MFGLRQKLLLGFGGLLVILLIVSGLGIAVLRQHRLALDQFIYENWRSVEFGQGMVDALDRLNDTARTSDATTGQPSETDLAAARSASAAAVQSFDRSLEAENRNITLPGEDKLAARLTELWAGDRSYKATHARVISPQISPTDRAQAYADLLKLSPQVKDAAQAIIRLNLENMKPIDGRAKAIADRTSRLMIALAVAGAFLAALFIAVMGRSILQPVQALTRSAREIEQGNLDLVVQVKSRDELRQLAEAFNSMAAKLREYRRTNRAKLVRTQETTQNAINSLPDAVAIVTPDGRVEMANRAAQHLFGLRPGALVAEQHAPWLVDLYHRTSSDLRPIEPRGYESAVQVLDEGGGEKFFLPHAVPILDGERQLLGVTVVLADVTHLRRLDEMKSGMVSVVSHELKTPLTSIRMGVHLLLEERIGSLNGQQSEILDAVREDSDRLNQIVENLLDMGRIESGRALLDLKADRPDRLTADAIEPMSAAYHDRGVELINEVSDDLPLVQADHARMSHVFSNLLTNALRYTPPGGQVRIGASADETVVRFSVSDTGSGIPADYIDRVFERFFRVPGQTSGKGAGLGLAITRDIVKTHGGEISVQSTQGQGSTFTFTLPRATDPTQTAASPAGNSGQATSHEANHGSNEIDKIGTHSDRR